MLLLNQSLTAWGGEDFSRALKAELQGLAPGSLPLHRGTSQGGRVDDRDISANVIAFEGAARVIFARVGVFFTEVVSGCSCGDGEMDENAYCELQLSIDKGNAETRVEVIQG